MPFASSRYRAGALYLALTAAVTAAVFGIIYFVFYPQGLFETLGGLELFFLIAIIGVIVGPLLVTIVYVPGKKGLAFDLVVIAALQLAALAYGLHILYLSRPAFIVFVKDRFEIVRANDLSDEQLARASRFRERPLMGPVVVGSRIPTDPKELTELVFASLSGSDVQHFPKHYVDYDQSRAAVRARSAPIARLRELNPASADEIDSLVRSSGRPEAELAYLPLKGDKRELAAIVDAKSGDLVRVAPLQPWK